MNTIRVLLLGDIVGSTGQSMFQKHIGRLKRELSIDALIVNGENSAGGRGITSRVVKFFKHHGVDVITTGNHIWRHREIYSYLSSNTDLLRPANYPGECPGVGVTTFQCKGHTIGVVNLQGRVFMRDSLSCPFREADSILTYLKHKTKIILVDFHAEATSEKMGLAHHLDGRVSGFVGTHTHVQTADERVLPGGTGYITDLGMAGALNSMLGMQKEPIIRNFMTQMPVRFVVDPNPPAVMTGVWMDIDTQTGKAIDIQRIKLVDGELEVSGEKEKN
jgi:metallophosphoesterase (TIGR00282 family)